MDPTQVSSLVDANQAEQNAHSKISKTETNENKVSEKQDELEKAYFKSMTQEDEDQPKDEAKANAELANPEEKPAALEKTQAEKVGESKSTCCNPIEANQPNV